jgi:hypothetical protein
MDNQEALARSVHLSRRGFIKLGALGLAGLFLPRAIPAHAFPDNQQGRVIDNRITVYDVPSFSGKKEKYYWKDFIFRITGVTVGDDNPAHNRVWYQVGHEGYVHSGSVQPVMTQLNQVISDIPLEGRLAEVTVPFTDTYRQPGNRNRFAYRFYYETTCWVTGVVLDPEGNAWYSILDDKWDIVLYAPAHHLRLVTADDLSLISPHIPPAHKRLEVRLEDQIVVGFEFEREVFMARASTGTKFINGDFSTKVGRYQTFHKRPSRHMAAGDLAASGYDLPGVPWVCYINEAGVAFHGTYWHNNYGRPRSHGCINLTSQAAKWIYRWTVPEVPANEQRVWENYGTQVDVV